MKDYQQKTSVVSTPERGGGSVLIEQKRYMSANEMYQRLYQIGYLADLRSRVNNATDHSEYMHQREILESMVEKGQCPKRPSMMDSMDVETIRRDVDRKINVELSKYRRKQKEEFDRQQQAAFSAAVEAEVAKRTNPNVSGGLVSP